MGVELPDTLGLIAGEGSLPLIFARQAKALQMKRLVAVGIEDETDPSLATLVDEIVWVRIGQLSRTILAFTERGIRQCVALGKIAPKNVFDVRPDLRAVAALLRIKEKNAHTLCNALADELQKDGVTVIQATPWLQPLMPAEGFHAGPRLSDEQREDVAFGFRIAKEISRLDIGQTVVVKEGAVLAVEGFEGTDECLTRGGNLAGKGRGAVAVKVAKENHDMRFDIPCIGPRTMEVCGRARISVLALAPGTTLLLEEEIVRQMAQTQRISITTAG